MDFQQEVADFFRVYVNAFARSDARAVSEMWEPVGLFPTPGGNFAMDREAFRAHCEKLMDFYRREGVVRPEGELISAEELFPGVAQARVAYRMRGESGALIAAWEHVYVLRRSDCWRVALTIADGELAAWTARGARF